MTALKYNLFLLLTFLEFFFVGTSAVQAQANCTLVEVGCNGWGESCPMPEDPCHDQWVCDRYDPQNCGDRCVQNAPTFSCWKEDCWDTNCHWDYDPWEGIWNWSCDRQCANGRWENCGGECERTEYQCWGGGCADGHWACVGGGCPVAKDRYCSDPVYRQSCPPNPAPTPCVPNQACINIKTGVTTMVCDARNCDTETELPMAPDPGCQKVGECYAIFEPGKCAQNCISANNVNTWDYCACGPGVNPPPAQNCPGYCGYAGGTVANGQGGSKICPTTPACPPGLLGNGNGNGNGGNGLSPLPTPVPIATSSFFQVQDAGVMAQSGGIVNRMPVGTTLSKGVAGVVIGNGASNFGSGHASSTNWVAGSDLDNIGVISNKLNYRYDYDYVSGRIISTIKPAPGPNSAGSVDALKVGTPDNGVYYVLVTGNLDITSNLDFGTSKVVVLVTGDANIKGKINFTKNQGLFALYVKGNINIDPTVGTVSGTGVDPTGLPAHLEGLYLAQGSINTGVATSQLRLEGAYVGIGGVNLQRNLNSAWPSEYFVFRPDILINLPKQLLRQNHIWQELAP